MMRFTFFLDWIISAQFAGLCWAKVKGLYAEVGLDVELIPWVEDGRSIVDKVIAGGLCAGSSEDNLVISACADNRGVKILGTTFQTSPLVLMSKHTTGIYTLQDLVGKRIGMHCDGIRILEIVLDLAGIARSDVEVTEVTFDYKNLVQDRFDAVQGYAVTEPIELAGMGVEVSLLPIQHPLLQPYAQVFFASEMQLQQQSEPYRQFLQASFEGWRQALSNLDEAAFVVAELAESTNLIKQRYMMPQVKSLALGGICLEKFGSFDLAQWQRNLKTYWKAGLYSRNLELADVLELNLFHYVN